MLKNIKLKDGSKEIEISNLTKVSEFGKIRGLMFRRRNKSKSLLFNFNNPVKIKIHSCFVFFPFLAIWIDDKNKILDKKVVKPWKIYISPSVKYYNQLIEIPLNDFYHKEVENIVGQKI